jgi:tetratricopeptide (TPR) repeat protein
VASHQANPSTARLFFEEVLEMYRRLGDDVHVAQVLSNLGAIALLQGDFEVARSYLTECLPNLERRGDKFGTASTLLNLGVVAYNQGRLDQSARYLENSLHVGQQIGEKSLLPANLFHLARVRYAQGHLSAATRLLAAVEATCQKLGIPLAPDNAAEYERCVADLKRSLTTTDFARAWAEGKTMDVPGGIN